MTYWNGGNVSAGSDTRRTGKWSWGGFLTILAQIVILAFYLKSITFPVLAVALRDVNWTFLLVSVLAAVGGVMIRSARRRIILRPIHHYPLSDLTTETIIAVKKKLYHPEHNVMRQLCQVLQLKSGVPGSVSIPYLLLDRVFDFGAGLLITLAVACTALSYSQEFRIFLVIGYILLNLIVLTIFIMNHHSRKNFQSGCGLSGSSKTAVQEIFPFIIESLRMITWPVGRRKRDIPLVVLFTIIAVFTDIITLFIAAKAVSLSAPLPVLILFYVFSLTMWLLPGFPGFPGLADFLSLWFLHLLGVPPVVSAIPILIVHCVYVSGAISISAAGSAIVSIMDFRRMIGSRGNQMISSSRTQRWINQEKRKKAPFLRKTTQSVDDGVGKARL